MMFRIIAFIFNIFTLSLLMANSYEEFKPQENIDKETFIKKNLDKKVASLKWKKLIKSNSPLHLKKKKFQKNL